MIPNQVENFHHLELYSSKSQNVGGYFYGIYNSSFI